MADVAATGIVGADGVPRYPRTVAERVWTAEELEQLSPAEQDALFEQGIQTNLTEVPAEFLARVRARVQQRIDSEASSQP
jgi:hypothetical protein